MIERCSNFGIIVSGSELEMSASLVRDIEEEPYSGMFGRGLTIEDFEAVRGHATVTASHFERLHEVGVAVLGADAQFDGVLVRNSTLHAGLAVQYAKDDAEPATIVMRSSSLEDNTLAGLSLRGASAEVSATTISRARALGGRFGDGILVISTPAKEGVLLLQNTLVRDNQRAGIANFGALVVLENNGFSCNAFHLNGETRESRQPNFSNEGGNQCGCAGVQIACKAVSSGLEAPSAVGPKRQP